MNNKLIKRVGVYSSLLIFLIFILNSIEIYIHGDSLLDYPSVFTILLMSILFLVTSFRSVGAYVQVVSILIMSILTMFSNSELSYAIGQIIVAVLLAEKYGFLKKRLLLKVISLILVFLLLLISIFYINNKPLIEYMYTFIFYAIFGTFIFLIKRDDIKLYFNAKKNLENRIHSMELELDEAKEELIQLQNEQLDPTKVGLTETEFFVLKTLCEYSEGNNDLANRLNKSTHTIKSHMKKILLKLGVESRNQAIELCRSYFSNY